MGLLQLLPKRYKEQVTFFRYVGGLREDLGSAVARFSYESSPDALGDLSGEQFDAKLLMEDPPQDIRVKHYVERENGERLVIKRIRRTPMATIVDLEYYEEQYT